MVKYITSHLKWTVDTPQGLWLSFLVMRDILQMDQSLLHVRIQAPGIQKFPHVEKVSNLKIINFHFIFLNVLIMTQINLNWFHAVTCPEPPALNHVTKHTMSKVHGGYPVGTVASILCIYHKNLFSSSTCQISGNWNPQPPTCNEGN